MTDDELKALIESNARAIEANNSQMADTDRKLNNLADIVQAFIAKLDTEGLRVTLITDVADDMAGEVVELERDSRRHDVSIEALRADAIADREAFKAQADADRQAFREEMAAARAKADADRAAWQERADNDREESRRQFDQQLAEIRAIGEQNRALLSALAATNSNVERLDDRVSDLEAS